MFIKYFFKPWAVNSFFYKSSTFCFFRELLPQSFVGLVHSEMVLASKSVSFNQVTTINPINNNIDINLDAFSKAPEELRKALDESTQLLSCSPADKLSQLNISDSQDLPVLSVGEINELFSSTLEFSPNVTKSDKPNTMVLSKAAAPQTRPSAQTMISRKRKHSETDLDFNLLEDSDLLSEFENLSRQGLAKGLKSLSLKDVLCNTIDEFVHSSASSGPMLSSRDPILGGLEEDLLSEESKVTYNSVVATGNSNSAHTPLSVWSLTQTEKHALIAEILYKLDPTGQETFTVDDLSDLNTSFDSTFEDSGKSEEESMEMSSSGTTTFPSPSLVFPPPSKSCLIASFLRSQMLHLRREPTS